jgi:hypothetical protein
MRVCDGQSNDLKTFPMTSAIAAAEAMAAGCPLVWV